MERDQWGRPLLTESEVIDYLYKNPTADISRLYLPHPEKHNNAIDSNFSELSKVLPLDDIALSPEEWHKSNQQHWYMPDEYKNMDIAAWILAECKGDETELQRCGTELLEYAERGLLPLLAYIKYLVDTMRANNVVWGVGRGSSVASFVLYKIGIHKINSITYELDFKEFMR